MQASDDEGHKSQERKVGKEKESRAMSRALKVRGQMGHVGFLHSITQVVLAVRKKQKLPVTKLSFKLYTSGPSPCVPVASREVL